MPKPLLRLLPCIALLASAALGSAATPDRNAYALTGGRVIAAPGRVIEGGVVVVRGGVIEAVGPAGTAIPSDATVIDVSGKVVHAAFIDPYVTVDRLAGRAPKRPSDDVAASSTPAPSSVAGPAAHSLKAVRAEARALDGLEVTDDAVDALRRQGFAVVAAVPASGVLRGQGAVLSLADGPLSGRVLDPGNGQIVAMRGLDENEYPTSNMGAVAATRQAFLDALWWRDAEAAYAASPAGRARPRFVAATAALVPAAEGRETVVFETTDVLSLLRAARVARELKLQARFVAAGDEYRLLSEVAAAKPDLVLRVAFPQPDKLDREEEWLDVSTTRLRALDRAPGNPRWLRDAGVSFSLTTDGLEKVEDFETRVRDARGRGLSADDALAAVTTVPARQLGLGDRLGTLEAGKIANLVVRDGAPFEEKSTVAEIWIDGDRNELTPKKADTGSKAKPATAPAAPDVRPAPAREAGPLASPPAVVVRGATVWTQGPSGIVEGADVLVVNGKIAGVGRGLAAPAGALEIDGRGKHVTPGIIDAHSHTALDDSTNEGTRNVTAEVRIRDVLTPFDVAIYRELAGGTTTVQRPARLGQLDRRPEPDREVALGRRSRRPPLRRRARRHQVRARRESRSSPTGTTPSRAIPRPAWASPSRSASASRRRRTTAAARTSTARPAPGRARSAIPPQPDLQLEAIAEILEGKRTIHCHSYRKDEILQMIRSAEEFGVTIATFQHVLEGYKVADEIASHGAGASRLLGLVGVQVRGLRRDPVRVSAHAGARRARVVQLRLGRARAAAESRGREGRQVRRTCRPPTRWRS